MFTIQFGVAIATPGPFFACGPAIEQALHTKKLSLLSLGSKRGNRFLRRRLRRSSIPACCINDRFLRTTSALFTPVLAGAGGYEDPGIDAAIRVFADAITGKDKSKQRVYFDLSGVFLGQWEPKADLIAKRLRTLGLDRVLYGSDGPPLLNWRAFRKLPLTDQEFRKIERNIAFYLK